MWHRFRASSIDHDEQHHQIIIDGAAGGLDNEHIGAADRFLDGDGDFAIGTVLTI